MKLLTSILFLLTLFPQEENIIKQFDSLFYDISVNIITKNPNKAISLADSILVNTQNEKKKIRVIMLIADIFEKQEKRGKAIQHAYKAMELAIQENDYSSQVRIFSFLSRQYRSIGFSDKGKELIKKGVSLVSNIDDNLEVAKYRAMTYQELAEYALEEQDYLKVIEYLQLAIISYQKNDDDESSNEDNMRYRYFVKENCKVMLGKTYLKLGDKEKAFEYFKKVDQNISDAGAVNTLYASLIYRELGDIYLKNSKIDIAETYLRKALPIAENSNNGKLKQDIYLSMTELSEKKNDIDSAVYYFELYKLMLRKNIDNKKTMINTAYNTLNEYPTDEVFETKPEDSFNNIKSITGIGAGIFLLISCGVYYKRKEIFNNTKIDSDKKMHSESTTSKASNLFISKKLEEDIICRLKEFEESNEFLDKEISFAVLVGKANTNSRYLREILRVNYNKGYAHYINDLRINYIVHKLKTDKKYLSYKISYLANEAGFSTHSKFSENFKRIKKQSPSEYITQLKNKSA